MNIHKIVSGKNFINKNANYRLLYYFNFHVKYNYSNVFFARLQLMQEKVMTDKMTLSIELNFFKKKLINHLH